MDCKIRISLFQEDLHWEDPIANLKAFDKSIGSLKNDSDLLLLPETFSTGFTMRSEAFAEDSSGTTVTWMAGIAQKTGAAIAGSYISRDGKDIYNRLSLVFPDGARFHYNKRHLFRLGRENESFKAGSRRVVFNVKGFRILPQICYDLRFPVFARNRNDYDILLYVANWPAVRHQVWEKLLMARAIENQAYVIGVNRSGWDGEGMNHLGGTCVIDPRGDLIAQLGSDPGVLNCELDLNQIHDFRNKFPVWKDADEFSLK